MHPLVALILLVLGALHCQTFSDNYDYADLYNVAAPQQATYETKNNPKRYNIGAILSSSEHIHAFIQEIERVNNDSLSEISFKSIAFPMSINPIETAQHVCNKLITSEIYAVIVSHPRTGEQSPSSVSFTCGFYNIPVIGISNRESSLSNKNLHSSFLRTIPPFSHQADVWIEMLRSMEYKSVVIIHSSDSDGRGTLSRFQNLADDANVKIESIVEYEPGISNITHELEYMHKNIHCRVFILYASAADAEIIFDKVSFMGMDQTDYVWIVSEQVLGASNRPNGILSAKLQKSEENLMITDSVTVLTMALREMFRTLNITTPPKSCGDKETLGQKKWSIGPTFYKYLLNQTFNGRSGRISFDESGDRLYSEYEILNTFNRDENSVGKYMFDSNENKMKLNLFMHLIKWPGNQNQKPAGFYVPKHLKVSTIAEKPFVWTKKLLRGEKCAENQIICPRFNKTKKKDDNFNDKEAYIDYFCCEGYCIDLLREMASRLNFTFELELVPDGLYGNLDFVDGYENPRRWTGLVGELVYKHVDMVVAPLTANPERSQVISFSKPFKYEGITILQKRQPRKATLASFLQPFQNTLWGLVLVSVHVVALALYLLDRFSPFGGYKMGDTDIEDPDDGALNLSGAIWFSWGVLLNSGIGEKTPSSFSARVLGMFWAGFAMIVVASYTANLAAFLVLNPRDDYALSGIEDARLRNPTEGFTFATVKGSSVDMFFRSQVHLFNAYRTMEETNRNSTEDAIEALIRGELDAFIWDSPRLEYEAAQDCELVLSGELFGRSGYAVGLQKNSWWTAKVTLALLRLHESGFMESLDNRWILGNEKDCESKMDHFPHTLGLKNMAGVFILVFSGIVLAFGLIVIEIIYKKRKSRKIHRLSIAKRSNRRKNKKHLRHSIVADNVLYNPRHSLSQVDQCECRPHGVEEAEEVEDRYVLPPPPPPPVIGQRMANYLLPASTQRTAQQKIYEFKHCNRIGYY
ncbi:Glutamate receptor ionotropic, NMDA 1 [Tyrophagus putrescentiae]|nr:Glutamate receptor ionotropic, NMDA 1 [Tyrophagus putrescentiae]